MNNSTDDFKNCILELIYKRKLEHEKELKPLYDQLVKIESLKIPTFIIDLYEESIQCSMKNY